QVRAFRAEVTDHHGEVRQQFTLHVQVPGLDICILIIVIDSYQGVPGSACEVDGVVEPNRAGEGERPRQWRVGRRAEDDVRHRLFNENSVSGSHRGLATSERVPRQTHTRLKIYVIGAVSLSDVAPDAKQRGGRRVEDDEAVVALRGREVQIVAQAKFERQVGSPLEVVLHEETYRVLLDAVHAVVERDGEGVRVVGEEGCDRWEVE